MATNKGNFFLPHYSTSHESSPNCVLREQFGLSRIDGI